MKWPSNSYTRPVWWAWVWLWPASPEVQPLWHSDSCQGALWFHWQHHITGTRLLVWGLESRMSSPPKSVKMSGLPWGPGRMLGCWDVYRCHCFLVRKHFPRILTPRSCQHRGSQESKACLWWGRRKRRVHVAYCQPGCVSKTQDPAVWGSGTFSHKRWTAVSWAD